MPRYTPIPLNTIKNMRNRGICVYSFSFTLDVSTDRSEFDSDESDYEIHYNENVPKSIRRFIGSRIRITYARFPEFEEIENESLDSSDDSSNDSIVKYLDVKLEEYDSYNYDATCLQVTGTIHAIILNEL